MPLYRFHTYNSTRNRGKWTKKPCNGCKRRGEEKGVRRKPIASRRDLKETGRDIGRFGKSGVLVDGSNHWPPSVVVCSSKFEQVLHVIMLKWPLGGGRVEWAVGHEPGSWLYQS